VDKLITPAIYVLAFVAVVLVVQTVASFVFRERDRNQRVNRRLTMLESGMSHEAVYASLLRQSAGALSATQFAGVEKRLSNAIRQASLTISVQYFVLLVALAAGGLWLFSLLALRSAGGNPLINGFVSLLAAAGIATVGAWMFVSGRRAKRARQIDDQLPLALDIINRALRAGHPVISAVQLAGQEMGDPLGTEFGLIVDETTYGLEFKDALYNFATRTGSRDAAFFAVSVAIQSQTGGNLAEILEGLAGVVRGRNTLAKRVKALASEGKASATLLSVLPLFLIGFFLLVQPQFYTSKFGDPVFWPVVAGVLVLYFIGLLMIRRIVNFKY
jgi:tight adherence protein B